MIPDGERLKSLVVNATSNVVLCAPFIKSKVLKTILGVVPPEVHVRIVTRWNPAEIAAGVSDLEAFDVANARPNSEFKLLPNLHAKLYIADDQCLIGSANLTASALGWAEVQNIEILVQTSRTNTEVSFLLKQLEKAEPVTLTTRTNMETAADRIESLQFDEACEMTGDEYSRQIAWLPRCAAPEKLYEIYKDSGTNIVADSTKEDGMADLQDLIITKGLSCGDFSSSVQDTLQIMPAIANIIEMVPNGITDEFGRGLIADARPDLEDIDVHEQWRIVRDWIHVFFKDRFEVAPDSYITRLKTTKK